MQGQPLPDPAVPPEAPTPPRRPRRRWKLGLCLLLLSMLLAVLTWLTGNAQGFAWLCQQLPALSNQQLSIARSEGNLWSGFTLHDIRWRSRYQDVDIDRLQLQWQPGDIWQGRLQVQLLNIGHVRLSSRPAPATPPAGAPASLSLPLEIRVEQLQLASLTLLPADVRFYGLQASYAYQHQQHQLQLKRLQTPWGSASAGLNIADVTPFATRGQLTAQGELEQIPVQADLQLAGNLLALQLDATGSGKGMLAEAHGTLRPFAFNPYNRFGRLDVRVGGINPQSLFPAWPKARLGFAVHAEPDGGTRIKGGLSLLNSQPGPVSASQLPLSLLVGEFRADDKMLYLDKLMAQLGAGQLNLTGKVEPRALDIVALIHNISLKSLHAAAPDDIIRGTARIAGPLIGPDIRASLYGKALQLETALGFEQDAAGRTLLLRQLDLTAGAGKMNVFGKLGLEGKQLYQLEGKLLKADPSRLQTGLPVGELNAAIKASGQLTQPLAGKVALQFAPSRLSGAPLSGQLTADWQGQRLRQLLADLTLANNRLQASGSYGAVGDKLKLLIDAPNLSLLGRGFSGTVKGQAELAGTPKAPLLSTSLRADRLHLPGDLSVQSLSLDGDIKADPGSPFRLQLVADKLQAGSFSAEQLRAQGNGTRTRHHVQLDGRLRLAGQAYQLQLAASGGLPVNSGQWQGVLERLELSGKPGLSLQSPLALEAGAARIRLGAARLNLLGGSVSLAELESSNGVLSTRGHAEGLHLAELAGLLQLPVEQNLVLDSAWSLNLNGKQPQGQLWLKRVAGDIRLPAEAGRPAPLGLRSAQVNMRLDGGSLRFDTTIDSQYAQLTGKGSLPWNGGHIDVRTPLAATATVSLPSLAALAQLSSPALELGGQLSANLALTGPLGQLQGQGSIQGSQLLLADHRTGIRLGDGVLQAHLNGRSLVLDRLRFASGQGDVVASGSLDLKDSGPDAVVRVVLNKFSVFDKPSRKLVVSGNAELSMVEHKIALTGRIRADQGRIDLPKGGAPTLSDDVIVKGRKPAEPSAFASLPLTVALDLDLGDRFRFVGQGLDVELTGVVKVTANPGLPPGARGQVRVVKGRYKAYGQDLDIEQGIISFVGPLDNPALNVVAKRHLSPVGAGVEVSGSVSSPRIRLVADESMSEKDKLAWLVLGHAASGDRDDSALAASAGMMLAGSINDHVGLFDELGMASRKERTLANGTVSPAEQVVTVGRQLTRELYLGYEYGVTSADQAVKLAYQLSKGWSMVLRAGTNTSVESRYTLRFD
ncbi:translocation/assembly module TamB domain-containing protein [Aquitalea denitrificans]|uniref:translocation/assembly module TamB domain-containing protein n=1 Tax=Aquitalea denitrificans TaxID=519081 RepID=UPI0013577E69|nr:translocation/assembly module TamB domain-containing protein [Aquitalea denitrificans]